jgi:hypothetical protein
MRAIVGRDRTGRRCRGYVYCGRGATDRLAGEVVVVEVIAIGLSGPVERGRGRGHVGDRSGVDGRRRRGPRWIDDEREALCGVGGHAVGSGDRERIAPLGAGSRRA